MASMKIICEAACLNMGIKSGKSLDKTLVKNVDKVKIKQR